MAGEGGAEGEPGESLHGDALRPSPPVSPPSSEQVTLRQLQLRDEAVPTLSHLVRSV